MKLPPSIIKTVGILLRITLRHAARRQRPSWRNLSLPRINKKRINKNQEGLAKEEHVTICTLIS
jgi:hypothetical protein